jgi:hypothetical protein
MKHTLENYKCYAIIVIVYLVYSLLLALQGFDICDEGLAMTSYQQIFFNPSGIEFNFMFYLTTLIGGLWNGLLGCGGYYSFRVLGILVSIGTFTLVYQLLKDWGSNRYLIGLGYFITSFISLYSVLVFQYNTLNTFFSVAIAYALYKSVEGTEVNKKLLFLASFLVGVNVFSKLTSLTLLGLVAVVLLINYGYNRNLKSFLINALVAVIGFVCGLSSVLLLMYSLGHLDIFVRMMKTDLLSAASSTSSSHSIDKLINTFLHNYFFVGKVAACFSALVLLGRFVVGKVSKWRNLYTGLSILFQIYFVCRFLSIYIVYAFCLLSSGYLLYHFRKDKSFVYLISIALSIAILLPLGSDFGIGNSGHAAVSLLLPLCLAGLNHIGNELKVFDNFAKYVRILIITIISTITLAIIYKTYSYCYFDNGSRLEKRYLINESPLATTFTTKEKAEEIDTLLLHLKPYIKEGDYTLFFQSLPTLHYLTKTKPYLHSSWVWAYDSDNMERQFKRSEEEINVLPIVVREKGILPGSDWLTESEGWNRTDLADTYSYKKKNIQLINDFLAKHSYQLVWEDSCFQIYKP